MRKSFSLIEAVFAVVILGVLAVVAVPRFVTTRTDSAVAALRNDASVATKMIVAKVFADNLNTTTTKAPSPNDPEKKPVISWSEWILEIGGLDKGRWNKPLAVSATADRGVSPTHNYHGTLIPCGTSAMIEILSGGDLYFNPRAVAKDTSPKSKEAEVCKRLRQSYETSTDSGNKIFPLTTSKTISY